MVGNSEADSIQPPTGTARLLDALCGEVVTDQGFENGEDATAIFDDAFEQGAQLRLARGFAIPLSQELRRYLDVAAKLGGRVTPEEQAIEEGGLALREIKIPQ
jgi:hypothetical protein